MHKLFRNITCLNVSVLRIVLTYYILFSALYLGNFFLEQRLFNENLFFALINIRHDLFRRLRFSRHRKSFFIFHPTMERQSISFVVGGDSRRFNFVELDSKIFSVYLGDDGNMQIRNRCNALPRVSVTNREFSSPCICNSSHSFAKLGP